jgi:hypothetical protein
MRMCFSVYILSPFALAHIHRVYCCLKLHLNQRIKNVEQASNKSEDEAEVFEAVTAVSSNMVLRGCFLHGICICRFTATQIKAKYH